MAAVLFSTGGTAIKLVRFDPWQIMCVRAAISCAAMLVLIPEARRGWDARTALVGAAYGVTTMLFVLSNAFTTAAGAVFLQNTAPLFVLLLAPWLLHERATRGDLRYMAVLAVGMVLLFIGADRRFATAPNPVLGNALAALCSLTWALTLIGYRWLARQGRPIAAAAAIGSLIACLVALPLAWPFPAGRPSDWVTLAYLGIFQLALAYRFMARALPGIAALEASLILLTEPVLASLWAWGVHGETLGRAGVLGAAVILVATVVHDARGRSRAATVAQV